MKRAAKRLVGQTFLSAHPGRQECLPHQRIARGSVLIFAVVVLAILAMLSSAFLIVARHAIAASKSGLNSTQADLAANAAIYRGGGFLSGAAKGYFIATPHGVVTIGADNLLHLNQLGETSNTGPAYNSPFNMFVHDPTFDVTNHTTTPGFAVLSSYYYDPRFYNTASALPTTPFYTTAPLRINPIPLPNSVANDPGADRASAYFVRATMTDFYNGVPINLRKALPSIGTVRARHYIWVRDLDANFYVVPAMWGINTTNVPNAPNSQVIAQAILQYLRTTPASGLLQTMHPGDPATIAALQPGQTYDNIGAFALLFPTYEADASYALWRADIEQYFTTYLDAQRNTDGSLQTDQAGNPIPQFKNAPAAININTAPEEVLQAMFSQIPYTDTQTFATFSPPGALPIPPNTNPPVMAELIAKRIIAKRPFLSRMDFEDFVASLLPGSPTDPADLGVITAVPDPHFPVGAIYYAIQKRIDHEIRLSQFMEMPGLPEGDYPDGKVNPYKNSNTSLNMGQRFKFFVGEDGSHPTRTECPLTVKAFNNFLNSVSTSPGPSLKAFQVMIPGTTGTPTSVVIDGNGGSLDGIHLGGDDVIVNGKVLAGPNGIAETEITGFSYYSHDYGGKVPNEYKPARLINQPNPPVLDITSPKDVGKFVYYGDPNSDQNLNNGPKNLTAAGYKDGFKNYFIEDLQKWSCVGDGVLSGYYDMWFNPYDAMALEFGHSTADENPDPMAPPPAETDIGVKSIASTVVTLKTGVYQLDDTQEVNLGEPVPAPGGIVVLPGPNGKIETTPNSGIGLGGTPAATAGDDKVVDAIRFGLTAYLNSPDSVVAPDVIYSFTSDPYFYIIPGPGQTKLVTPLRPNDPNAAPGDSDTLVQVIVDGGNGTSDTQVPDDVADPASNTITVGPNKHNETIVWGPIRASQRGEDQILPVNADQVPTARITSGNNGDVAWSPQICFRSRFYGMYVLAQGLNTQPKVYGTVSAAAVGGNSLTFTTTDTTADLSVALSAGSLLAIQSTPAGYTVPQTHVYTVDTFTQSSSSVTVTFASPLLMQVNAGDNAAVYSTKIAGERRTEVNYDAYNDEVLWKRSPLTDKRALGDP